MVLSVLDGPNNFESMEDLQKAAEGGDPVAQCEFGVCYGEGRGVPADLAKAVHWFRKAAEQGHAQAQCELAICFEKGLGVARDAAQAVHWYRRAAEQGDTEAQYELGLCFRDGMGVPADPMEGVTHDVVSAWYSMYSDSGKVVDERRATSA